MSAPGPWERRVASGNPHMVGAQTTISRCFADSGAEKYDFGKSTARKGSKTTKMALEGCPKGGKATRMEQKGVRRVPKGRQMLPKGRQMEPKGSQREPKGAKREPKVSQRAIKMHPKIDLRERLPKRSQNCRTILCFLAPFWNHFPSKIDEKNDAKIDA